MAMNLARTGVAAAVGAGSGAVSKPTQQFMIGTTAIPYSLAVEVAAAVVGAGLQFISPFTAPTIADGLVDGGIALLAARGVGRLMNPPVAATMMGAYRQMATRVSPELAGVRAGAQIGSIGSVRKVSLT
jgi:hypothetical protein